MLANQGHVGSALGRTLRPLASRFISMVLKLGETLEVLAALDPGRTEGPTQAHSWRATLLKDATLF